jgi:FAD-linked oxidoreductase
MASWRNWSGSVRASPQQNAQPRSVEALADLVRARRALRVAGSGHSFTPLCATPDTLVQLDDLALDLEIAPDGDVWVPAGWTLARATQALAERGYALSNQGDINAQAVAGALATATHGTGRTLPCLSAMARGFDIVRADGTRTLLLPDDPFFAPAQVSLGAFGVILRVKLIVVPLYRLQETMTPMPLGAVIEEWDALQATHRHVEFWQFPHSDTVLLKTLQLTDAPDHGLDHADMSEAGFVWACRIGHAWPRLIPWLQGKMMSTAKTSQRCGQSWRIFPNARTIRFEEMEYALPAADGFRGYQALLRQLRARRVPVMFPLEVRMVAGDDLPLSPFQGDARMTISVHQWAGASADPLFMAAEPVLRAAGGRPHWGKRHSLSAADLGLLYPQLDTWRQARALADPEQKFVNPYLRGMLGL